MAENYNIPNVSKEKFEFVNQGDRISDKKFENKPVGYFRDAWRRFCKSKASVVALIIIIIILLFSILAPLLITTHDNSFMVTQYARKPARVTWMRENLGMMDGGVNRENITEAELIRLLSIGVGAVQLDEQVPLNEAREDYYQPVMEQGEPSVTLDARKREINTYDVRVDTYLEVGFLYMFIEQPEYQKIVDWQNETGIQVLYPLVEDNEWNPDATNANNWYKAKKVGYPVTISATGNAVNVAYSENMVFEDNYKRNDDGSLKYFEYSGGGTAETAQYKIRVLFYNYYQYKYGFEPNYVMGTESQGYDMALRIADGIQLSFVIAIFVCVINFVLGALYGAVEGYYGGAVDLILERVSDILSGVPFIVVATLFQIHLASKVGALPSLLFAFVVTGWIGTAYRVRTQFYRFKNQEYVMAARTLGARDRRIIWKHIFPNTLGTIITSSALAIPSTIMSESMLSYLGIVNLGGSEGTSLGTLLSDAESRWIQFPHLMLYPALIISLLMISFNLFGNGLRDAFNPALRGVEE